VITVGEIGGSFNITVSPPTTFTAGGATKLEDVVVSLKLGENATGLKGSISSPANSASRIQSSTARGPGDKLPAGGTWEFDTTISYAHLADTQIASQLSDIKRDLAVR